MSLPKGVTLERGKYYYRPYIPETKKSGKRILLGEEADGLPMILMRYEELLSDKQEKTLGYGVNQYLDSRDLAKLADTSRRDAQRHAKQILNTPLVGGLYFSEVPLDQISTGMIQKYHDKRSGESEIMANKEVTFLSVIFNWLKRRDIIMDNPATGVKRNSIAPRDRYVTDDEFFTVLKMAKESPQPYLAPAMILAYVCRARRVEILNFRKNDIVEEGLYLKRRKGSKNQIIGFTPMLEEAISLLKGIPEQISSVWLLHDRKGQAIRDESFKTAWGRLMTKAVKEKGIERFHFHDLKAKGVSDFEGDKLLASGHKTLSMLNVYDRKLEVVSATR